MLANFRYLPNLGGNAFFVAVFAALFVINIPLGIIYKTWGVMVGMLLGVALEAVGYGGRVWDRTLPFDQNPFLIYIICLTIAPAFLTAAIYLCLSRLVVVYGEGNAFFKPRTYSIVFMIFDFIALVLQGAGGGIASSSNNNPTQSQAGINVMIAGLAWQVVSLTIFAGFCADLAWGVRKGRGPVPARFANLRESRKFRLFMWMLGFATLLIYIRSIYRVAELSAGFHSDLANNEVAFMVLDGALISLASIILTVLQPGVVFKADWTAANFSVGRSKISPYSETVSKESGSQYEMNNGSGRN